MTKPRGYWEDTENVMRELLKVISDNNFTSLPSENKLTELGHFGLRRAIQKKGGMPVFRKLFGQEQIRVPRSSWFHEDYTVLKAQEAMDKLGVDTLPGSTILRRYGYSSLGRAITKYHGGFPKFRKKLGQKRLRAPSKIWKDLDYVLGKCREVMESEELETLPQSRILREKGYSVLDLAISQYHGGYARVRQLLGQKKMYRKRDSWKSLDYAIDEAKKALISQGWDTLPNHNVLTSSGHGSLAVAISKYHGGYPVFRRILESRTGVASDERNLSSLLEKYASGGGK